jgi:hypothetical protein
MIHHLDGDFVSAVVDGDDAGLSTSVKPLYYGWTKENPVLLKSKTTVDQMRDFLTSFPPGIFNETGFVKMPFRHRFH